jgi:hypothetical protein
VWAVDVVASVAVIDSTTQSVPTAYRAHARGRWWYANSAWDAFGVCAALQAGPRLSRLLAACRATPQAAHSRPRWAARPALRDVRSRLDLTSSDEDRMSDPLADAWRQAGG